MPKLPDLSGYSFEELSRLVALATKRVGEIRGKRIKELQAELGKLEADEGRKGPRLHRKSRQPRSSSGLSVRKLGPTIERKIAAQFRGPNGEGYSGRGAIPRWARDLGVNDRAGLEKYRLG